MLKILRNKKTAKKVWIFLAVIIIPAFALWGFGGAFRSKEETAVIGKIAGHNVTPQEFKEALSGVRTLATLRFGDKLPEIEKYLNLEAQAWQRLVLLYEAKERKIRVSDKEIIETIQTAPYFQDKKGFSNKIYSETLRYVFRLQPRIFEEQTRQNLILNKLYNQITKDVKVTDQEIRSAYEEENQELSIQYMASLFSDFSKGLKPSDKELAEFFEKNKAMFKAPPSKDRDAYIPGLEEVKDKVKEALIKEISERSAKEKINVCAEKLKTAQFNQAAGLCGLKTTKTGLFKAKDKIENLGNAGNFWRNAKNLKVGQPSGIISNENGYYIITLASIKPIDEARFAKEKEEFSKGVLAQKKGEFFYKFTEESLRTTR